MRSKTHYPHAEKHAALSAERRAVLRARRLAVLRAVRRGMRTRRAVCSASQKMRCVCAPNGLCARHVHAQNTCCMRAAAAPAGLCLAEGRSRLVVLGFRPDWRSGHQRRLARVPGAGGFPPLPSSLRKKHPALEP